jgi:hypothetical protein
MADEKAFTLPSKTEIAALKAKHGSISQITVKDKSGNEFHAILRKPKLQDMQIAAASEAKKKFTYNLSIWNNCKLSADPAIEADDFLLVGALQEINSIVQYAESSIKEL